VPRYPGPPLAADRWSLRPWRAEDAPRLADAFRDAAIRRSIPDLPRSPAVAEGEAFVRRARERTESGEGIHLAIASADDDRAIGAVTLHAPEPGHWFVGYWMAPQVRRRGITSEALAAATRWAFAAHPALVRISLFTRPDNVASHQVATRAGFTREGVLRRWHEANGIRKDVVMFSLVRDDLDPSNHG
jgi:ribosomal-protein-alanine N-acetyltransferase